MKLIFFSTFIFSVVVLFSSCGQSNGHEGSNEDSIRNGVQGASTEINLTSFSSIPDSLSGCSCIFSESESKYEASNYLYFDDMGTACLISVDNKLIVLKPIKITEELSEFSNGEFTAYIQNKKKLRSSEQSTIITGELVVKNKNGATVTKKVYGVCGC
jgi:hypothetical protein